MGNFRFPDTEILEVDAIQIFRDEKLFQRLFTLLQSSTDSKYLTRVMTTVIKVNRINHTQGTKYVHEFTLKEIHFVLQYTDKMIPLIFHIMEVGYAY